MLIRPYHTPQCTFTAGVCNRNAIVATSVSMLCPCVLRVSRRSQEQFENVKKSPGRGWSRCRFFLSPKIFPVDLGVFLFPPSFSSFVFFCILQYLQSSSIFISYFRTMNHEDNFASFVISICGGHGRYL